MVKKNYTSRELARHAKRHFVPGGTSHLEDCTYDIAFADSLMKKGEYNEAMKTLEYAGSFELPYLPEENKPKVARAIINRAYRVAGKGKNAPRYIELAERANKLEEKLHNLAVPLIRKRKSTLAAAILSLAGGLLLISSSITGSAITNLSSTSSSLIGTILVAVGLIGGFFWLKKN